MQTESTTSGTQQDEVTIRARSRMACDLCRLRKAKCYGGHPCGRCLVDKVPCTFGTKANRRERNYPKGYVHLLERQQARLVDALRETYRAWQLATASSFETNGTTASNQSTQHPRLAQSMLTRLGLIGADGIATTLQAGEPSPGLEIESGYVSPNDLESIADSIGAQPAAGSVTGDTVQQHQQSYNHNINTNNNPLPVFLSGNNSGGYPSITESNINHLFATPQPRQTAVDSLQQPDNGFFEAQMQDNWLDYSMPLFSSGQSFDTVDIDFGRLPEPQQFGAAYPYWQSGEGSMGELNYDPSAARTDDMRTTRRWNTAP